MSSWDIFLFIEKKTDLPGDVASLLYCYFNDRPPRRRFSIFVFILSQITYARDTNPTQFITTYSFHSCQITFLLLKHCILHFFKILCNRKRHLPFVIQRWINKLNSFCTDNEIKQVQLIHVTSGQKKIQVCESYKSSLFLGSQILSIHHILQINYFKSTQCDFLDFFFLFSFS